MIRETCTIRPNSVERCKEVGFDFYNLPSSGGLPYWREGFAYRFTVQQIDALEEATNTLHQMCLAVAEDIVKTGDYPAEYALSDIAKSFIELSWRAQEPSLYGRFDLAFNGTSIKMLEYNADTPTSLLESAIVQWHWLEDLGLPDQFNSLHERLIEQWKIVGQSIAIKPRIYFVATEIANREDWGTIEYLMDVALQGGVEVSEIPIEKIGWNSQRCSFTDLQDRPINACFKLYPWEWILADQFGAHVAASGTRFIEPAWKLLLSSKALLPVLWKKYDGHPLLLPSFFDKESQRPQSGKWIRKPILAREGANVSLLENGAFRIAPGSSHNPAYDNGGYVLQQWVDIPSFDGFIPILGSWIVGNESAGMGIREDVHIITGNTSHFVPHYFA